MSIIQLEHMSKAFGQHQLFENFNLQVESGEMLCLWGKSGCGKTTLLNILGLLDGYDTGTLEIAGVKNPACNGKEAMLLRRNILGYIFQSFALIDNETVDKNLDIALTYNHDVKDKKACKKQILEDMNIASTQFQKVYELSGGEQQRVALARVFLKPCQIILADEPTGSLDKSNKDLIVQYLHKLNQLGKTIIIVTHDWEVAESCHRIIRLSS